MRVAAICLLTGMGLVLLASSSERLRAEQPDTGDTVVKLTYTTMKDINDYVLPKHVRKEVVDSLDLPNGKGRGIKCNVTQQYVEIDMDLDGKPDTKAAQSGKVVEINVAYDNGVKRKYAILLWHMPTVDWTRSTDPMPWYYTSASAVSGVIDGKKFLIFDDNCNGTYNDFGADSIVFASGKGGWYIAQVMDFGKGPVEISVAPDGTSLSYHPVTGPTGSIDVLSGLAKASFKPLAIGLVGESKTANALRPDGKPALLPVGKFRFDGAVIDRMITVLGGSLPASEVTEGGTAVVKWGGPFTMLFMESPGPDYPRAYRTVNLDTHTFYCEPPYIKGQNGEVYVGTQQLCLPDKALASNDPDCPSKFMLIPEKITFQIEILEPESRKVLNPSRTYTAARSTLEPNSAKNYQWDPFIWAYKDLRGTYLLRVTCPTSKMFKEAVFEEKIELK
ncbi:MAG: hypothetical protein WC712_14170 [Candidatus Brocadiia bacterium]